MFCNNCGNQIPDGVQFCGNCGTPVKLNAESPVQTVQETTYLGGQEATAFDSGATTVLSDMTFPGDIYQQEQNNAQSADNAFYATQTSADMGVNNPYNQANNAGYNQGGFYEPTFEQKPKKKGKTGLIVGIAAAVAVVAVGLAVVLNFSWIQGWFIKTFSSDEKYFQYVEYKAFSESVDDVSKVYGKYSEALGKPMTANGNVGFNISDEALDLLADAIGEKIDLDFIKDINFDFKSAVDGGKQNIGMTVNIGDNEIVDFDSVIDMKNQEIFVGLLNLSDKYVKLSDGGAGASVNSASTMLIDGEFTKCLPNEEELNKLLKKYLKLAIDNLDNVSKSSETLDIDGVKQKVTVLEFELNQENVAEVAVVVLKELKDDKDFKGYVENIDKYLEDEIEGYEGGEIYDELVDAIDDAIDELKDFDGDDELLTLVDYVNSNHEVIGRSIEIEGEEVLYYATARSGKKFAFEAECAVVEMTGSGTDVRDVINGEYTITVDGKDVLDIALKNFNIAKADDGVIKGSVALTPDADFLEEVLDIGSSDLAAISLLDPGIEIVLDTNEKSSKITLNITSKGETFVGLVLSGNSSDKASIKKPSDSKVVEVEDVSEWIESLDFDKLVKALEKSKLPDELVTMAETALEQLENMDDYYGNDYGYGYDDDYGYGYDDDFYYDEEPVADFDSYYDEF